MKILGIDVGGTGIKGAPVELETGELTTERYRLQTPQPATPDAIGQTVKAIVDHFAWSGPIGCGFPAAIQHGVVRTAANIDRSFIGTDLAELLTRITGCPTCALNDADAAGLAEMSYGSGRGHTGVTIMVTVGTGLGTAIFVDGVLLPNTELGHIEIDGHDAETWASDAARKHDDISWKKWATRFNHYLGTLEALFFPDLFIIGGGAVKKQHKFLPRLKTKAEILPAMLGNNAGIVGAALAARP